MVMNGDINCLRQGVKDLSLGELVKALKPQEAPPSVQLSIETLACEMQMEWARGKEPKQVSKTKHVRERKHGRRTRQ